VPLLLLPTKHFTDGEQRGDRYLLLKGLVLSI
jgi:hypothetical protein